VREATGSLLTNKYAEGYPNKRWYDGCQYVDEAEHLAIERAKQLFGAEHANVQPHCGSSANLAVYLTVLRPGDTPGITLNFTIKRAGSILKRPARRKNWPWTRSSWPAVFSRLPRKKSPPIITASLTMSSLEWILNDVNGPTASFSAPHDKRVPEKVAFYPVCGQPG